MDIHEVRNLFFGKPLDSVINYLLTEEQTPEICLVAVNKYAVALKYVNEQMELIVKDLNSIKELSSKY